MATGQVEMKEVEKLESREKALCGYMRNELVESQARLFTDEFCRYVGSEQ